MSNSLGKRVAFGLKDDCMAEALLAQKIDRCETTEEVLARLEISISRFEELAVKWKAIIGHIKKEEGLV